MIFFCLLQIWAQLPEVELSPTVFPKPEYSKTPKGASVIWLSDARYHLSRMELYFDQGIEGCKAEIGAAWDKEKARHRHELLKLGSYTQFVMQSNSAFAQIAIPQGKEKRALQILSKMLSAMRPSSSSHRQKLDYSSHSGVVREFLYGSKEDKKNNCRQAYQEWLQRMTPRFAFVGKMDMGELIPFLDSLWTKPSLPKTFFSSTRKKTQVRSAMLIHSMDLGPQMRLTGLIPIPSDVEDAALKMYTEILGGGFTSRLTSSLREEKGWLYHIETDIERTLSGRYIRISTQLSIADFLSVHDAIQEILRSMVNISQREMRKVQNVQTRVQRENLFDGQYLISALRDPETFDRMEVYERAMRTLSTVEIESLAEIVLAQELMLIVSGKQEEIEKIWSGSWEIYNLR